MAIHEISCNFAQALEIVNNDLTVLVKRDGELFGTLTMSKGSIDWRPAKAWRGGRSEVSLDWSQFDRVMRDCK